MKRMIIGAMVAVVAVATGAEFAGGADGSTTMPAAASSVDAPAKGILLGKPAPEMDATTVEGKAVKLADFAGKVVVLQFGSISEPVFRTRVVEAEKMAGKYGDKVAFVLVYQHEAHAADGSSAVEINTQEGYAVARPVNEGERVKLAEQAVDRLKIKNEQVVVDAWSNTTSLRYGDYPNMTFVIDAQGNLQAGYPWMDPKKVEGAVDALLAGKTVPAEYRGRTQAAVPGQPDLAEAGKEIGVRGAALPMVLDNLKLTDAQKRAVLPALTAYLAEARDFREKHGGGAPGAAGGAKGAGSDKAGDGQMAESPEDFKKALDKLRDTAQKLKDAVKTNLSEADAKQVLDMLDKGPARKLFAD